MIAKAEEFAAVAQEMEDRLAGVGIAADDAAALVDALAGRMNDVRDAAGGMGTSAEAAASRLNDLRGSAETLAGADAALIEATVRVDDALDDQMISAGAAASRLNDLRDAVGGEALAAGAAALANKANADAMNDSGNKARSAFRWFNLSSTAIHWIISGSAELLAVLIPATVAAGAWAFAWVQGATNVYQHLNALFDATEAWGQAAGQTYGELLGLHGIWQQIQNEANPDVYQALGGALNLVKESFGGLAGVGLKVGEVFDSFMGKLVYDFSAAGGAGATMGGLLHAMEPDLIRLGEVFGNLGAALAAFASQMPGLAEFLLHLLAVVTGGIKDIIEFSSAIHIGSWSILTFAMALEEFNRWGSLFTGLLGRMGIATAELNGKTGSYFIMGDRFIGILKNLIGVLPMAALGIMKLASRIPVLGAALIGQTKDVEAAQAALKDWIEEMSAAEAISWVAAAAGLGLMIWYLSSAKTQAQKLGESMQKAAQDATDLNVLSVIGNNLSTLQGDIKNTSSELDNFSASQEKVAGSNYKAAAGISYLRSQYTGLSADQVQQVADAGQVVTGASQIAKAYGLTIPQAMELAQEAGVNLTGAVQNQKGQWTALGEQGPGRGRRLQGDGGRLGGAWQRHAGHRHRHGRGRDEGPAADPGADGIHVRGYRGKLGYGRL